MRINLATLAFGYKVKRGDTPNWATPLGQGSQHKIKEDTGFVPLLPGLIYCSFPLDSVKVRKGKGGRPLLGSDSASGVIIAALFHKVYVNGTLVPDGRFLLYVDRDDSPSHNGRLRLRYSKFVEFKINGVSTTNEPFVAKAEKVLGMKEGACWFVYDISILNQDELHFSAVVVDSQNKREYEDSQKMNTEWEALIPPKAKSESLANTQTQPPSSSPSSILTALRLFSESRDTDGTDGWASFDEWAEEARRTFADIDENAIVAPGFDYDKFVKFVFSSRQRTAFSKFSNAEKAVVGKFLREEREEPHSVSWHIDPAHRVAVKGVGSGVTLNFMMKLHPEEFSTWSEMIDKSLHFLGLREDAEGKELTVSNYEECKALQQRVVREMREQGVGKSADDPSPADYLTVNEFLWWVDKNKDAISKAEKEERMAKILNKPTTGRNTTGTATIGGLLKNREDSLMTRLVAALLTKPLVILAGASGTGKSRMVRHLAYMTCLDADLAPGGGSAPGNFKMVQVKPNWHDSADLLGYRSAVSETSRYVTTEFVKFVLKAHAYPATPFFVCLDEMNLAPVEHYFAEFLSACESIRETDGGWTSDPIVSATDFGGDVSNLEGDVAFQSDDADLDAYLRERRALIEKEGLFIPRNLFVVGTVNMDETTGGFSRKVLDRAMTIEMNEVDFSELQQEDNGLTLDADNLFAEEEIRKFIERPDFGHAMLDDGFRNQLEDLRAKLEKTPFALAYRFARETTLYRNALETILDPAEVVKDASGSPKKAPDGTPVDARRACGEIALDHMVLMKLLPRLSGTLSQRDAVLKDIAAFVGPLAKDHKASLAKLEDMKERARDNGEYLSFWP